MSEKRWFALLTASGTLNVLSAPTDEDVEVYRKYARMGEYGPYLAHDRQKAVEIARKKLGGER